MGKTCLLEERLSTLIVCTRDIKSPLHPYTAANYSQFVGEQPAKIENRLKQLGGYLKHLLL